MRISAQVSLYPLRQPRLTPVIEEAVDLLRELGLRVEPGAMSTVVVGEQDAVFAALKEVFRRGCISGDLVMHVAVSNACPLPRTEETQSS
jgi:uncharacterized protein YqgV (UPF0045/DUF77 family)